MSITLRSVLLGTRRSASRWSVVIVICLGVFAAVITIYALELVSVSGGVVWMPFHAAVVGTVVGTWIGYSQRGFIAACLVVYASLLGYHADRAFFGLSNRSFPERTTYFFRPDGLGFLAVEAVALGTVAFVFGSLVRWSADPLRKRVAASESDNR